MNEVKVEVLRIFFSSNTFFKQETAKPKQWFAQSFNATYDIMHFLKQYDRSYFPSLLQRAEAEMMLSRVARRISREKPDIPCFTVHDSIITTVGNEKYVSKVIKEEFGACVGTPPHLKLEYYTPESKKILSKPF
jgi:hypothetical protein